MVAVPASISGARDAQLIDVDAGGDITLGDLVYMSADGAERASSADPATANVLGMVVSGVAYNFSRTEFTSGDRVTVARSGKVTGFSGLVQGGVLYLGVDGAVAAAGKIQVAVALDETSIVLALGGGGGGGGGGAGLLFAQESSIRGPLLVGQYVAGTTTFMIAATQDEFALMFPGDHIIIGDEPNIVVSVDSSTFMLTVENGLLTDKAAALITSGVLLGNGDSIVLPGEGLERLDVFLEFDLPPIAGGNPFYGGMSLGDYHAGQGQQASRFWGFLTYSRWLSVIQVVEDTTFSVGILSASGAATHTWTLEFNPATTELSLAKYDSASADLYYPRITSMKIAGS